MALQLKIVCPIHNISIMQEPISYINLWVCPKCAKCYTNMNVDMINNIGSFKGMPLVALPETEQKKIKKQVEEYKWKYESTTFVVPHDPQKKKKTSSPRGRKKTAKISENKSCPQIEIANVHILELPAKIKTIPQN